MIVQPLRTINFHGNGRMGETNLPIIGSVCFSFQPVVLKTTRVWSMTHGVKIILIALRKFSIVTKFKFHYGFPGLRIIGPKERSNCTQPSSTSMLLLQVYANRVIIIFKFKT